MFETHLFSILRLFDYWPDIFGWKPNEDYICKGAEIGRKNNGSACKSWNRIRATYMLSPWTAERITVCIYIINFEPSYSRCVAYFQKNMEIVFIAYIIIFFALINIPILIIRSNNITIETNSLYRYECLNIYCWSSDFF